jgi:quercetin dioxygenase-like cupin family protein
MIILIIYHTHNSHERMILISGDLEVQYQGEKVTVLKASSYTYSLERKLHRAKYLNNGPCVLFVAMVDLFDAVPIKEKIVY